MLRHSGPGDPRPEPGSLVRVDRDVQLHRRPDAVLRSVPGRRRDGPERPDGEPTAGARRVTRSRRKHLATALAGSAVGPVFPKFFRLQVVCAALAF